MVEWPGVGSNPGMDALAAEPEPPSFTHPQSNLVNSTMETFLQKRVGPTGDGKNFTCMGCHNRVRAVDYVFAIPLNAKNSVTLGVSPWRRAVIDSLTSIVTSPEPR
jgi:hypothetical protein